MLDDLIVNWVSCINQFLLFPIQMIGGADPNLVNPQNKQGYGRNVQTQLLPQPKTTPTSKPATPTVIDSIGDQSIQAVLQLGVLVSPKIYILNRKST